MSDIVVAVHPVPTLARSGRSGRPAWSLVATSTPLEIPRVRPGDVRPVGLVSVGFGNPAIVGLFEIEGRPFVEVGETSPGERFAGLAETLAGMGGGYRHGDAAASLLAGTPASAIVPGIDGQFRGHDNVYGDERGGPSLAGRSVQVLEDHADAARSALRSFARENMRLAGERAYVDAGGPLYAPVDGTRPYLALMAPRTYSGYSLVRLREGEIAAYAEATGFRMGTTGREPVEGSGLADGDADLIFANAAVGQLAGTVAPHVRKSRRDPGGIPPEAAAAFEALARPAWLGACGLLGEDDIVPTLRLVRDAIRHWDGLGPPAGMKAEHRGAHERLVETLRRDIDLWVMPRALARQARFDAEDAAFLPGPASPR